MSPFAVIKLLATLGSGSDSEGSVQYWIACFESGETSCGDLSRPGRLLPDLAEPLCLFLQDCAFTSARTLSQLFNVSAPTVKEVVACDLGL
jgi:hypothetical protein